MKLALTLTFTLLTSLFAVAAPYPALPASSIDSSQWGQHIQRTMGLLAESTPTQRNTVRILFYGQSIIGGQWHTYVEEDLRQRFPHADLIVENRAIGGFSSEVLIKTLEHDLLVSRPDLVVFRVAGDHIKYEEIVHTIRQRSAAEVMLIGYHWTRNDWKNNQLVLGNWSAFYERLMPAVAKKYACEYVAMRTHWTDYLTTQALEPAALLRDNAHLNEHGRWLMAQLTLRQMQVRPEGPSDISRNLVQTYEVGKDIQWQGNTLDLDFKGSRIDVIRQHAGGATCRVEIDGQAPSALPALSLHTRPSSIAKPYEWPEIMRVGFKTPPEPQTWTLTITEIPDPAKSHVAFTLEGSRSGPDGSGTNQADFVSNSGQVTIAKADWAIGRKGGAFKEGIIQPGMKIRWQSTRLADDIYFPTGLLERTRPVVHTLANGLPNTRHTLRLISDGIAPPITHIRVYCPLLPDGPFTELGLTPDATFNLDDISAPTPLD